MPYLVRKFEMQKWTKTAILDGEMPSADAITSCMRTSENKLSLWSIEDVSELDDAVLAIAGGMQELDTIDILWADVTVVSAKGLRIVHSPTAGRTAYEAFKERHWDVVSLDYWSLGTMAEVVVECIRNKCCKRIHKRDLKGILTRALEAGKLSWPDLHKKVRRQTPCPPALINEDFAARVAEDRFDSWRMSLTERATYQVTHDGTDFHVNYRKGSDGLLLYRLAVKKGTGETTEYALADLRATESSQSAN